MTPLTRHARRGAVLLALVTTGWLLDACSSSPSSTTPSPVTTSTPTPIATAVSVVVSGSAPQVGTTTQFSATATLSDGTTVSVTSTASWSSSNSAAATVSASGAVTGVAAGDADITATYQTVSGKARVTVVRAVPATFTITGTLRDGVSGGILPNVIVEAEPAGAAKRSAPTDASGVYAISGLPPGLVTLRVTESSYQPLTQTVMVSADTRTDLALTRIPPPEALSLAGTWTGTGSDGLGPETFTWVLAQSGTTLSGSVRMRPLDETDGSCGSCHKVKDGTISGSISGSAVTLRMSFALGGTQPTPTCLVTIDVSASGVTRTNLSSTYNGRDSCEPAVGLGTITMTQR